MDSETKRELKIYFAGAIRGGRDDAPLYTKIVSELRDYGEVLTEHIRDPELTDAGEVRSDREIFERDLGWLKESNVLVAEVTTPSLGVGYEIAKATEWGIPVLCLFRPDQGRVLSALIAAGDGITVRTYERANLKSVLAQFFNHAGF